MSAPRAQRHFPTNTQELPPCGFCPNFWRCLHPSPPPSRARVSHTHTHTHTHTRTLSVLPSRTTDHGFAVYEEFLHTTTATGEPLGFKPAPADPTPFKVGVRTLLGESVSVCLHGSHCAIIHVLNSTVGNTTVMDASEGHELHCRAQLSAHTSLAARGWEAYRLRACGPRVYSCCSRPRSGPAHQPG